MASMVARVVNRVAHHRYAEFWSCLVMVDVVLEDARKLVARMDEGKAHWRMSTVEDVNKSIRRVETTLRVLTRSAKRWEAELISREWRK